MISQNLLTEIREEIQTRFGLNSHFPGLNVSGLWPSEMERLAYAVLAGSEKARNSNWINIGSWNGSSDIILCLAKQKEKLDGKVYSIDPKFSSFFDYNISKGNFGDLNVKINDYSQNLRKHLTEPVGFAFIDGFHSFLQVLQDFAEIEPLLVKGGVIAFHDCSPQADNLEHLQKSAKWSQDNFTALTSSKVEDFYIDEAIGRILERYPDFQILKIPIGKDAKYFAETGLKVFKRGKTSCFNSLFTIKRNE